MLYISQNHLVATKTSGKMFYLHKSVNYIFSLYFKHLIFYFLHC